MTASPPRRTLPEAAAALGPALQTRWDAVHNDERALPDIAAEALGDFDAPPFRAADLAAFLMDSGVPQPGGPEARVFSDAPVRVHHGRGFDVEVLTWLVASTSIHEHAFSGAFKVVHGSSLHSVYRFERRTRYSARVHTGTVRCARMERLSRGDVRRITSGPDGLAHALFHLDSPSATVVVRTVTDPDAGPQLTYYPPGLAYERPAADPSRTALDRVVRAFGLGADGGGMARFFTERMLDLPTELLVDAAVGVPDLVVRMTRPGGWAALAPRPTPWAARLAARLGPDLAGELTAACAEVARVAPIRRLRAAVRDPGLRFFLALLLNGRCRSDTAAAAAGAGGVDDPAAFFARSLLDPALAAGGAGGAPGAARGLPGLASALARADGAAAEAAALFAAGGTRRPERGAGRGADPVEAGTAALRAVPALRALIDAPESGGPAGGAVAGPA